ncbi:MAG: hypothetical protein JW844_04330 [Candidatus Omnitrophica bacterium]|nr:hypothetical protein [Candidatus Omnitrophota bacterium]
MLWRRIKKNYRQMKRRLSWSLFRRRHILSRHPEAFIRLRARQGDVRLHLCCGTKKYPGYINIDVVPLEGADIIMNIPDDLAAIPSECASEILMESGFEHFYQYQQDDVLRECRRILKEEGRLVLKWLPDFDLIVDRYVRHRDRGGADNTFDLYQVYRYTHAEPTPENSPHQLHKDIFTKDSVRKLLERNGFYIEKLSNEIFQGETYSVGMNIIAVKPSTATRGGV